MPKVGKNVILLVRKLIRFVIFNLNHEINSFKQWGSFLNWNNGYFFLKIKIKTLFISRDRYNTKCSQTKPLAKA